MQVISRYVKSIILMVQALNLSVIAEGVETEEQFKLLQQMSCDAIQGDLFSKPVDTETATALLAQKYHSNYYNRVYGYATGYYEIILV